MLCHCIRAYLGLFHHFSSTILNEKYTEIKEIFQEK